MVVDGTFGKNSIAVLEVFENFHQPTVKKDGRVDPLFTSLGAKKMFLLNQILFFAGGLRGGVPETRVPFPQSLINHLYR